MNDIIIDQEEERIEPFATVMELCEEYGYLTVIESLSTPLGFEVQEDSCCVRRQMKAMYWDEALAQALARFRNQLPEPGVMARVNHPLSSIVQ
jgi:hypothetical protein